MAAERQNMTRKKDKTAIVQKSCYIVNELLHVCALGTHSLRIRAFTNAHKTELKME